MAIAAVAFTLRAAVAIELGRTALFQRPQLDSFEFFVWGQRIAHGFLLEWLAPTHGPGYPFFLGTLLALTGGSLPMVRLAQAALGAGLCVLTAVLAARVLNDRRAGLAAGLLLAAYGPLVYVEVSLLAEGLFVFLLTLGSWLALRRPSPGAGAVLGLAAVVRATALPLGPLLAGLAFLRPRRQPRRAAVWMALAWLAVVGPVVVFQRVTRGSWLPVQAFGGLNFYMGNHSGATGVPTARLGGDWDFLHGEPQRLGITGDAERERYFMRKAWREIGANPSAFFAGLARKALWLVQDDEIRESHSLYFFEKHSLVLRRLPGFGLLFPFAVWGLWLAFSRRAVPLEIAVYLLVFTASCVVIIVSSRYRLPLVPVLAVFAGGAVVWLFDRLRGRRWRELAPAAAVLAGAILLSHVRVHAPSHNLAEEEALTAASWQLLGRLDAAEQAAGRALAEDPHSALAWVHAGRIRVARGDFAGAEQAFARAVALAPEYQLARLSLGIELRRRGDTEGALRELRRSLWLVPDDPGTLAELGELLMARGETGEAAQIFRRLLEIDPRNAVAWLRLARIALDAGETVPASRALDRAGRLLGPESPAIVIGQARLDILRGDRKGADRRLRELLRRDPGLEPAARLLRENAEQLEILQDIP